MTSKIVTRYFPHPGSNVGKYSARVRVGQRVLNATVRSDQSLSSEQRHRAAADKLAARAGLTVTDAEATDCGYEFTTAPVPQRTVVRVCDLVAGDQVSLTDDSEPTHTVVSIDLPNMTLHCPTLGETGTCT